MKKPHADDRKCEARDEAKQGDTEEFVVDIAQEANCIFSELAEFQAGDFVAVRHDTVWFPGRITKIKEDGLLEVSGMKFADEFIRANKFRWVERSEGHICKREDVLMNIAEPVPDGSNKRLQYYKLTEEDFKNDVSDVLKLMLVCK